MPDARHDSRTEPGDHTRGHSDRKSERDAIEARRQRDQKLAGDRKFPQRCDN